MIKLIAIVGTNSKRSTNRQLLQYMQKHFADKAEIELVEIKDIPVFNKPADKQVPDAVLDIVAKIEEADGVIIGTPEYDHSIPAVLMSALAWLSYGVFPLLNKPVMITGASYGTLGSSRAQLQLRQILNAPEIKANVLPDEFLLSHSLQGKLCSSLPCRFYLKFCIFHLQSYRSQASASSFPFLFYLCCSLSYYRCPIEQKSKSRKDYPSPSVFYSVL